MTGWTEQVRKAGETAKFLAAEVPRLLADEGWPTTEAVALLAEIGSHSDTVAAMLDKMADDGANEHLIEAAEAVEEILLELHAAVGAELAQRQL